MTKRISWDAYFMKIARVVAERSTCLRRQIGAILVRDKIILSTGYNGAPRGVEHCLVKGCIRNKLNIASGQRHELCKAVHAEQNAIIQAAVAGSSTKGAEMYVTLFPCVICAKMIINAGISKVTYAGDYGCKHGEDMAKEYLEASVILEKFTDQCKPNTGIDWDVVRKELDSTEWIEGSNGFERFYLLGTTFNLTPNGKYYTHGARSDVTTCEACSVRGDVPCTEASPCTGSTGAPLTGENHCEICRDAAFYGLLQEEAEAHKLFIITEENDPHGFFHGFFAGEHEELADED